MDRTVVSAEKLNGEILEKLSCSICGYSPIFIECNLSVNNFSLSLDSKSLRIENLNLTDEFLSFTFSYTHKMIDFNQSIEEKVSDEWSVAHFFASAKEIVNRIYSSKHSDQSDYLFLVKLVNSVDELTFNLLTTLKSCSLEVIQSIKTFSEAESLMVCYNNDLAIIRRLLLKLNAYLIKIKSERLLGNNEPILLLNDTDTISHSIEIQKLITRSNVMYNFLDNLSNYLYSVLHSIKIALNLKKRLKNLIGNINKNIFVWDYLSTYSKHFFTQISDNLSCPSFAYLNNEAATISTDCLRSIKNLNEFKNWLFVTEHIDSLHLINKEVNSYQNTLDYYNYNKNTLLSIIDASSKIHEIYQRNNYDSSSLVELYEFRDKFDKLFVESSILCKMLAPNFISVSIDTVFNLNSQLFYLKAQESQWSCDYKYFGEWLQPVFNIFDELVHKISLDSFHNCDPTNDKKDLLSIKDKLKNIAIDIQTYVAIQDKALVVLHDNQRFSDLELILRKVITQIDSMVCSKVSKYQRLLDLIDLHYKLLVLKYSNNNIFFYTVTYNHENKQLTEETEWLSLVNSIPSIKVLAESCCRIIIPDISNCPYFEHLIPSDFFSDCNDQDISSEYSSWFNINFDFSQLSKLETFSIEATLMELSQLNILETSILVHQKNLSQLYEISLENLKLFPENINSECAPDSLMEAFETCVISICFIQNLFGLNDNLNFLWTLLSSKLSNKFIVSNSSFDFGNVYKNIDKLVDGLKLTVLPISEQFSADFYNQYKTLAESIYPLDEIIDTNASELDSLQHFNEYHNLIVNEYHQEMLEDYTNSVIQIDQLTSYTTNYNEYVLSLLNSIETDLKVPANLLSNTSNDDIVKENSLKLQFEKISIELVNVCKFLIKSSDLDDHYVFMYIETINSFYQMLEELFYSLIKSPIEKEQIESTIEKDCKSSKIYSSEFKSIKDVHMELSSVDSLVLQNYVSSLNGLRLKEKILSDFDYVQTNIIEKRTATLLDNIDDKMEKFTLKKKDFVGLS